LSKYLQLKLHHKDHNIIHLRIKAIFSVALFHIPLTSLYNTHFLMYKFLTSMDSQTGSLLYNHIPAEIRIAIFSYTLTSDLKPDSPWPLNISRPGCEGKQKIDTSLLQTCQLVYLETRHLPAINKVPVFWHAGDTGPYRNSFIDRFGFEHEEEYFSRLTSWQLKLVKEVHLITQSFWLEQTFSKLCRKEFMHSVKKVRYNTSPYSHIPRAPICLHHSTNPKGC
jgi:hypothetical protein